MLYYKYNLPTVAVTTHGDGECLQPFIIYTDTNVGIKIYNNNYIPDQPGQQIMTYQAIFNKNGKYKTLGKKKSIGCKEHDALFSYLDNTSPLYHYYNFRRIWFGVEPYDDKLFGNAVLIELCNMEYILIGKNIQKFTLPERVEEFWTPNLFTMAWSKNYIYTLHNMRQYGYIDNMKKHTISKSNCYESIEPDGKWADISYKNMSTTSVINDDRDDVFILTPVNML
jgi:hypothetical protein